MKILHSTIRGQGCLKSAGDAMKSRGFTLLELIVAIAVLVILITIAIPSYVEFRKRQDIVSVRNEVLGLVASARGQAIKGRRDVSVELGDNDGWPVRIKLEDDGNEVLLSERTPRNSRVVMGWAEDGGGELVFNR